jgi:hypothetical protein
MNSGKVVFYHSDDFLNMFSHLKFTEHELKTAFQVLRKIHLIEQISFKPEELRSASNIPPHKIRYAIVDQGVRELVIEAWKFYKDKHTLLYMKSSVEEPDEKDIRWLSYLFGDNIANKMLRNCKIRQTGYENYRASPRDIEKERTKASYLKLSSDIKEGLQHLNEKYRPLMEQYNNFPLYLIPEIALLK